MRILDELSFYINSNGTVGIDVAPKQHTSGLWSVEADLTLDGEVIRHYAAYDLLVMDLMHLELAVLSMSRKSGGNN